MNIPLILQRTEQELQTEDTSYGLFLASHVIADLVLQHPGVSTEPVNTKKLWLDGRRKESINPFYNQTRQGLFLEQYYSLPSSLWTPLGKYQFGGSGAGDGSAPYSWAEVVNHLTQALDLTVFSPALHSDYGTYGPIYAVHSLCGIPLPAPETKPTAEFLERNIIKTMDEGLRNRYELEFGPLSTPALTPEEVADWLGIDLFSNI